MKSIIRIVAVAMAALALLSFTLDAKGAYKRVVILGVDGAGAWFSESVTPNTWALFSKGAYSIQTKTSLPTISAQCWGSMLLGVLPEVHHLDNSTISRQKYDVNSPYPSIFRVAKETDSDVSLASFCNWKPINNGIIESNLGVVEGSGKDPEVAAKVLAYLDENDPTVLFVQFDSVDGAGHRNGYGTKGHLDALTAVDVLLGQIYEKLREKRMLNNTLLIVAADHGGTPEGRHGGDTTAERLVFMGVHGKTVIKGSRIADAEIQDIPMIAAHALGLDAPSTWTGKIPMGIFR